MKTLSRADRERRFVSAVMTSLTMICTVVAVGILLVILGYIAMRGVSSLNWRFLVDSPRPVGEGGGIGNAIVGSAALLILSCLAGIPLGIATGVYLSEVGRGWFVGLVRFLVDTLTGIPSIVTGVFVYAVVVLRMKHFSALAGGIALALIMIPIVARTTEEMIKLVPQSLREGALALGVEFNEDYTDVASIPDDGALQVFVSRLHQQSIRRRRAAKRTDRSA